MLKLPLCPFCGARFLYPDVKKTMFQKTGGCPHCENIFFISLARLPLMLLAAVLFLVGMNWLFLTLPTMNLLFLMIITAIGVVAAYYLTPFTVRYIKPKNLPEERKPKKK